METVKNFFLRSIRFFWGLFNRKSLDETIKDVAREAITQFINDLKRRLDTRLDQIDPDEIAETVIGWIYNLSAAVPGENDAKLEAELGELVELNFGGKVVKTAIPLPIDPKKWSGKR